MGLFMVLEWGDYLFSNTIDSIGIQQTLCPQISIKRFEFISQKTIGVFFSANLTLCWFIYEEILCLS